MSEFGAALRNIPLDRLDAELDLHIEGLKEFFSSHDVQIEPKPHYRERFSQFVTARTSWLSDEARVERMARRLHIEQMPDIWGDEEAATKFETSFFEDLSLRLDASRSTRIVDVLKKELKVDQFSVEALRDAFSARLNRGFTDAVWSSADE